MPRKLKTYQTSQGFYDLAIAAPSMKAALEAWGASSSLFHQGFAKESEDSKVIAAAMAKPGIVMRRPVGSDTAFSEHSELPSAESLDAPRRPGKAKPDKDKPAREQKVDEKAERRAAAAYEKEQQRRERQRQKEEAAAAKARAERKAAMEKAETALSDAKREHDEAAAAIEQELAAVQRRADAEQERAGNSSRKAWKQLCVRQGGKTPCGLMGTTISPTLKPALDAARQRHSVKRLARQPGCNLLETAYDALFSAYNKLDQGYDLRKVVAWVEWESKPLP